MSELNPDTVIDGRYRVISLLGSGGMADVYLAEDAQLDRQVALKVLYRRFAQDQQFVERFQREARAAAGLTHPHVVAIYDRGEWDGSYYIAMEYLPGLLLKDIVREGGPLPAESAIDITVQVLEAAAFAHQHGIVHRDLKPHNVIVDDQGRAKVTDFGIARAGSSDMTETGSIMGTAQYLSPEQAQGFAVDQTSDIYSIGVMLFELLTGEPPFTGDSPVAVALKHVTEQPPTPRSINPQIPEQLDAAVMRSLQKDPTERFSDANEFAAALKAARGDAPAQPLPQPSQPVVAASPSADSSPAKRSGLLKSRLLILLGILLIAALAVGTYLLWPEGVQSKPVPNVVGSDLSTATAVLHNKGFNLSVQRVVNSAPKDRILRQDPQPQTVTPLDQTISLTVSDGPGDASVLDVTGMKRSEAKQRLTELGFKVKFDHESSDTVKTGRVTRTTPPAGVQVEVGTSITVFISTGRKKVAVPDLRGKSRDSAESQLAALGLTIEISEIESTREPGTVLNQDPLPGNKVAVGSSIKLLVAKEAETVIMPDVVGESSSSAATTLSALGLTVVFKEVDTDNPQEDGLVIKQNPTRGKKLKKGSRVTITIGKLKS